VQNVPACHKKDKIDILLWGSIISTISLYLLHWHFSEMTFSIHWLQILSETVYKLINTIWWGLVIGIIMVGILSKVPREFVLAILGEGGTIKGVIRATLGGVLLDLCSHGILMVGAKLYERGASVGQVMAFLIASPWNSFSLTLIMFTLIGIPWTLTFIALSMLIAIISGIIFDWLVSIDKLPPNPNKIEVNDGFQFWREAKLGLKNTAYDLEFFKEIIILSINGSRMVLKWILFGVILSGLVQAFVTTDNFQTYFGPTLLGLGLTVLVATIMEVCSEGSTPIAADILTRAKAPGNSFAFLMTGYQQIILKY
jgi:uncharacterized protein